MTLGCFRDIRVQNPLYRDIPKLGIIDHSQGPDCQFICLVRPIILNVTRCSNAGRHGVRTGTSRSSGTSIIESKFNFNTSHGISNNYCFLQHIDFEPL